MPQLSDTFKLIDPDSGREIMPGESITDFRGVVHVFRYISRAPAGTSTGKVFADASREFYPQVFGLKIVPR